MAPKLRVTLAADIQEQASGVPSLLAQMPSIHVVAARLPCGDYCLVSVSVSFGVPVLRATDARDSASLIATAARQLCERLDIPYVRPGYRPTGWRRRALYILKGLPGVGPQRARALLERFGSVAAVAAADVSALADVAGIGGAVARSIREALGEEMRGPPRTRSSDDTPVGGVLDPR